MKKIVNVMALVAFVGLSSQICQADSSQTGGASAPAMSPGGNATTISPANGKAKPMKSDHAWKVRKRRPLPAK